MMCKTSFSDELLQNTNVAVGKNKNPQSHVFIYLCIYLFIYNFCAESFLSLQNWSGGHVERVFCLTDELLESLQLIS